MARRLIVIYHEDFKSHAIDSVNHPESPRRLDLALESVDYVRSVAPKRSFKVAGAPRGSLDAFSRVHKPQYFEFAKSLVSSRRVDWIDSDTYVSRGTLDALTRLVGSSHKAVSLALRGVNSFILGRPPSHHAGASGKAMGAPTMGFCIFNATALIASILSDHGRVAVVDFDVHHGNGTQDIFYRDPRVLHIDIHADPSIAYPGTGYPDDVGEREAAGTKVNIVVPSMAGDDIYMDALRLVDAILASWKPDYIVASAGFDAYRGDNEVVLMNVGTRFYYAIGRILASRAKAVVSVLEGGYGAGLDRALKAYMLGLLRTRNWPWDPPSYSSSLAWKLYRHYRLATITNIVKYGKILLPEELTAKALAKLRPKTGRRVRRKRKFRRYI